MKKAILLSITILLITKSHAQDGYGYTKPDSATLAKEEAEKPKFIPLEFSEVVKVDSVSKDDIYSRARAYIATIYNDSKSVIQMDDRQAGIIIGKAIFRTHYKGLTIGAYNGFVDYNLKIEIKEGRFRFTMSSFVHTVINPQAISKLSLGLLTTDENYPYKAPLFGTGTFNKIWRLLKEDAQINFKVILLSLIHI